MRRRAELVSPVLPALLSPREARELKGLVGARCGRVPVEISRGVHVTVREDAPRHERARTTLLGRASAVDRRMRLPRVFTRETAAILHGVRTWGIPDLPQVVVPQGKAGNATTQMRRLRVPVEANDITTVAGLRTTTLERTVLDIARFGHPRDGLVTMDHYAAAVTHARRGDDLRVDAELAQIRTDLLARLDRLPPRSRGVQRARAVIEWMTPWAESAWESHLRWVLLTWGRRDVEVQVHLRTRTGSYWTDLALPVGRRADGSMVRLHIEFDGAVKYSAGDPNATSDVLRKERRRENAILRDGELMIRFDAAEAGRPRLVVDAIAMALAARATPRLHPVTELFEARGSRGW